MTTGTFITLTLTLSAIFVLLTIEIVKRYKIYRREKAQEEATLHHPRIEAISIIKKVLLDEGEVKTIPVSILPKECIDEIEVEYTEHDICKVDIIDEGLMLTALKQGKIILTVHSGEVSERCLVCVRKRLTLDIMLKTDKSGDKVGEMTAFLSSDEEIKYRCQVLFNVTADGKNRYFFANKGASESSFISNRHEDIPHVGEELAKLRKQEGRIQSLRLWVTNLKYDEDRYHIVIKNRYKAHHSWWKKYDK